MKLIHVAAGVLNQTPLDWARNLSNIVDAIGQSREQGVSILCLPELCITGYGCEDAFQSAGVQHTAIDLLFEIAQETEQIAVSVGLPLMYSGGLFNAAALIVNREIAGIVCKQHLAGDGIHYEPRWFKRWPEGIDGEIELHNQVFRIGDLIFDVGDVRLGFEICEDAWVGNRPGARHAARGADIILNPSASHFAFDKHRVRRRFVLDGSRAFHVSYVYANLVGNEAGRAIYDGDAMIATGGELVQLGRRFSFKPTGITSAIIDVDATRMSRARTGSFEPEMDGDESDVIQVDFDFEEAALEEPTIDRDNWEDSDEHKCEEFTRSAALGLFDYVCKSRSRGVVVSLSGGVDSSAVVVIASMMLRMALNELGMNETARRLSISEPVNTAEELCNRVISTVYQATRNSSDTTRQAAEQVAEAIGTDHLFFDIDEIVQQYMQMIEGGIQRKLQWETDDTAMQNIQARVRSPGVWMIANLRNALLLCTSNRSESAVGYATMDGDTSGGLAPIAGIDKAFLRKWLRWIEVTGPCGLGPIPAVASVNRQQPTAELRPQEDGQTDEGDLMPYDVLDEIERLAIRDKLMPIAVFEHMRIRFENYPPLQLGEWIVKFFMLWCRNQWKRERFAPSFHYDDENLDPKTWCRFPILSGGFEREIAELQEHLKNTQERMA